MMLSADKREEASSPPYVAAPPPSDHSSHPHKRARTDTPVTPLPSQKSVQPPPPDAPTAAASSSSPSPAPSPYSELQKAVHNALESRAPALTTADKVALALEVLRARQLELDLAQARSNIEALVNNSGTAPRTLRAVIPSTAVKGLPVGTPVDVERARFLLTPTTNDPQALFLTLELQTFGAAASHSQQQQQQQPLPNGNHNQTQSRPIDKPSQ